MSLLEGYCVGSVGIGIHCIEGYIGDVHNVVFGKTGNCRTLAVRIEVELEQEMAKVHSVIMDGRDIGTVVLPDAEVKIYLDAGVEERARRRAGELEAKGEPADFEEIKKKLIQRDYNDMNREHSPLKKANDAISLDSTSMTAEEVQQAILHIVHERVGNV